LSLLLKIARESITEVFEAKTILNKTELLSEYPALKEAISCFVSIYKDNKLLGRSGEINTSQSLLDVLIRHAKKAAFDSKGFSPLKVSQYIHSKIELSLLTPQSKLEYTSIKDIKSKLKSNIHGLVLLSMDKKTVFLPQQWIDYPSFEEFFSEVLKEANLTDLSSHPKLYTFEIERQIDEPIVK